MLHRVAATSVQDILTYIYTHRDMLTDMGASLRDILTDLGALLALLRDILTEMGAPLALLEVYSRRWVHRWHC